MITSTLAEARGAALPMALWSLLALSAVVIGFTLLSASEPTIAHNQLAAAQARALAEAGVERALWALNHPEAAGGIPPASEPPSPYDGSQLIRVGDSGRAGGFRLVVRLGALAHERHVTAVGWVPDDSPSSRSARQKITAVVANAQLVWRDPPAAVASRAALTVGGASRVDARSDDSCGRKAGIVSGGNVQLLGGAADVRGASDDPERRNAVVDAGGASLPGQPSDIVKNVGQAALDPFLPSAADIDALRALAKAKGTYFRGAVTFGRGTLPNGLVFIDTVSGGPVTAETPADDMASVRLDADAPGDPSGVFSGWLVVNGALRIAERFEMRGRLHAQAEIVAAADFVVSGAVSSANAHGPTPSSFNVGSAGSTRISFNCQDSRAGGGAVPARWFVLPGSYREAAGT